MKNTLYYIFLSVSVLIMAVACSDAKDNVPEPDPKPEPPVVVSKNKMTQFSISKDINGTHGNILGIINEEKKTITLQTLDWIENIEGLIPTFETTSNASVNGVSQTSKTSILDFTKTPIVYKLEGEGETSVEYTVTLVCPQTSGIPVIKIDVEGGVEIVEKTSEYYNSQIVIKDYENPTNNLTSATGIRGRGNTTWGYDKKPFRIKFDEKTSLFGLGAEKSWVLLANYLDPSLLMTAVALEAGQRIGLQATNHEIACEFFMNGTYRGHYTLTEQVEVASSRVNVDKKKGFLIELDIYYDEEPKFTTDIQKLPVMIKSPKAESLSEVQWVQEYIQEFENELMKDFSISKYKDYVDVNSVVNYMILNEIIYNLEMHHPKSFYMFKDANSKMNFGPIWDFDWGFGKNQGAEFIYFESPNTILLSPQSATDQIGSKFFARFLQDPDFLALYKARWNELKTQGKLDFGEFIDQRAKKIDVSQQLNYRIWNNRLNFHEQIGKMKSWMNAHISHVDKAINNDFK